MTLRPAIERDDRRLFSIPFFDGVLDPRAGLHGMGDRHGAYNPLRSAVAGEIDHAVSDFGFGRFRKLNNGRGFGNDNLTAFRGFDGDNDDANRTNARGNANNKPHNRIIGHSGSPSMRRWGSHVIALFRPDRTALRPFAAVTILRPPLRVITCSLRTFLGGYSFASNLSFRVGA